jgi:metal-sulfur cluster biosynthetic enzyme
LPGRRIDAGRGRARVGSVPGIGDAEVELVWDPPWDPQKMSDEAKLELGML